MKDESTSKRFPTRRESTIAFLRRPYDFISETCRQLESDVFLTRILLEKTVCMTGEAAARLFYDESRFRRSDAAPGRLQKTLFGRGGVQGLDDAAHRQRKSLFLGLMAPARVESLVTLSNKWWHVYAEKWQSQQQVVLYHEVHELLCQAVCEWAGVPLEQEDVAKRTHQLVALFDYAGSTGPKHWVARWERKKSNRWAETIIRQVRHGELKTAEDSVLAIVANHRDLQGKLLDEHIAAVELLNLLRPTVAVSVYFTFAAVAMNTDPRYVEQLRSGNEKEAMMFTEEVRRYFPFFPAVVARVRQDFDWQGYHFPRGRRVLLDLYGTNHDPRVWEDPAEFRPERFHHSQAGLFGFIPQGGGETEQTHRCPGEPLATGLIKTASTFLARRLSYEVPEQDLEIDRARVPALPSSGFIMTRVKHLD